MKWEYKVLEVKYSQKYTLEDELNVLGKDGWKLKSTKIVQVFGVTYIDCILKRPLNNL